MKRLTLLRHAKSSWKDPALEDFDRPLNRRGKANAPDMGRRLAERGVAPEVIIASPAKRARKTAELVAAELPGGLAIIRFEPRIYEAEVGALVELVGQLDDAWQDVMLVGHNPGLTELAHVLAPGTPNNIVTCGVVRLAFEVSSWLDVRFNSGQLLFYDFPKKIS